MNDDLLIEEPIDGVAQLRINRPNKRNALNLFIKNAIADSLEAWRENDRVRVVLLSGEGPDFAAGSDLNDLAAWTSGDHAQLRTNRMWEALQEFPKPIVAAVSGRAWGGGCELAMACDLIVADQTASFAQPEVRLGVSPGAGGVQRLVRLVGRAIAMRMVLTGEALTCAEAWRSGLLSDVVETGALSRGLTLANKISAMPESAVQAIKELARVADNTSLDRGLALERQTFVRLCDSTPKRELMDAFIGKRH